MIISFVCRDKLVHAKYVANESVPHVQDLMAREVNLWCLCAQHLDGHVMRHVEALTCLDCFVMASALAVTWHSVAVRE